MSGTSVNSSASSQGSKYGSGSTALTDASQGRTSSSNVASQGPQYYGTGSALSDVRTSTSRSETIPTKLELLTQLRTASEEIASSPTTSDLLTDDQSNLSPLAGPAAMAARREFSHAPFNSASAFTAYRNLGADDFAGPDDMRLQQLSEMLTTDNTNL